MSKDTETLDKLYLEWSQFTTAKTKNELLLERKLRQLKSIVLLTHEKFSSCLVSELSVKQWDQFIKEFPDEA